MSVPRLSQEGLKAAISGEERERREESSTRRLLKQAQGEVAQLEAKVDLLTALDGIEVEPAEWAQPKDTESGHRAIANLLLSDLHLDEVVDPAQMRGMNAYDREIAAIRLQRLGERTIRVARDFVSGVTYDGLFLWANGDIVSGNIHDELQRTNAGRGVTDTIDYWVDPLAGLFNQLADFFGKVHIVSTVGNHGRSYKKPPAKDAVRVVFRLAGDTLRVARASPGRPFLVEHPGVHRRIRDGLLDAVPRPARRRLQGRRSDRRRDPACPLRRAEVHAPGGARPGW